MPGVVDKIIINCNSIEGMNAAIDAEFKTMHTLGGEILEKGLLPDAEPVKEKLKAACVAYDRAQMKFLREQRACIAQMAGLIDEYEIPRQVSK